MEGEEGEDQEEYDDYDEVDGENAVNLNIEEEGDQNQQEREGRGLFPGQQQMMNMQEEQPDSFNMGGIVHQRNLEERKQS